MGRCDENLDQYLKRSWSNMPNEFDPKLILVQTTVALSYLHGLDIVHGDLKPENVLVQQMAPKITLFQLTDYGLGRKQHSTPATCYEAPELHSANKDISDKPTAQSDVWALGVLAFYVLSSGKLPFGDADILDPDTFMTKWEIVRQAEPLFGDWTAAELVSDLLRWNPEDRCKSYLIIHQPYFSLTNESSLLFLAKQVYDLFPIYGGSFERNDYEELFRSLDKSLRSTENEQFFEKLFESICYTVYTIDNRPEFADLMNSIKLSPKHFAGYFWHFLKTFDWDEFDNHEDERSRTIKKLGSLFQVRKSPMSKIENALHSPVLLRSRG
jgi:serine/threonine protein kinase